MQRLFSQYLRTGIAIILIGMISLLTACGTGVPGLSQGIVQQAIALQLTLAQEEITRGWHLANPTPPDFAVKHVRIEHVEPTSIADTTAYRVTGSYDLKVKSGQSLTQPSRFEVYLQPQLENETWRLARLQGSTRQQPPTWGTYLIPMD